MSVLWLCCCVNGNFEICGGYVLCCVRLFMSSFDSRFVIFFGCVVVCVFSCLMSVVLSLYVNGMRFCFWLSLCCVWWFSLVVLLVFLLKCVEFDCFIVCVSLSVLFFLRLVFFMVIVVFLGNEVVIVCILVGVVCWVG